MVDQVVLVIAYDEPDDSTGVFVEMVDRVRPLFSDKKGLMVHAAIRESAREVLNVFNGKDQDG